ncbi:MAG: hypothetical protein ABI228_00450, partial [Burkholderiaceae bacterium]
MSLNPKSWPASVVVGLIACAAFSAAVPVMAAEDFPSRPLTFIVPYSPGGPLDTMSRLLAKKVQPILGQTVIVE